MAAFLITRSIMQKFIIGKKQNMTQVYDENGRVIPVTIVNVEPCIVTQVMTEETDEYSAVQLGYGTRKEKNVAKPQIGHSKGLGSFEGFREFRMDGKEVTLAVGDMVELSQFEAGDRVKVTGLSKGKGFQGVVKRHGFKGQPSSHGTKDQVRMPGSVGATGPQRVFKGTRMGGQMGDQQSTSLNLEVVKVDVNNNQLYLRGAVPGARNGVLAIYMK